MGPTLYRLASERRYNSIIEHIQNHPEDVHWRDRYGSSVLHLMCQAPDVTESLLEAVKAVLRASPSHLIISQNRATCTPLHYAAGKRMIWGGGDDRGTELVLLLLKHGPEAVSVRTSSGSKAGRTPFHIACEANADSRVLKAMLLINPRLATEPYVKKDVYSVAAHPLQLLWNSRADANRRGPTSSTTSTTTSTTHEKMALLLRAAHYGTVDDTFHQGSPVLLLHAACSVRCPQDYFLQLLEQHRDQISTRDERGLLPLHYAIEHASVESQPYTQFVVESLLQAYPQAASVPNIEGRLPLHVALMDSKLTWHKGGIQEIVFAFPEALRIPDPINGLPPFLASAYHAIKSMLHLSTTFELLRTAPELMEDIAR